MPESNNAAIVKNLVDLLKIPIDHINYITPTLIELFYNGFRLGSLETIKDRDEIRNRIIISNRSSLQSLDWNYIFKQNESLFASLVASQLNDNTAVIKSGTFRNLTVAFPLFKKQFVYKCSFENGRWKINS
jgi:hypothetical protein